MLLYPKMGGNALGSIEFPDIPGSHTWKKIQVSEPRWAVWGGFTPEPTCPLWTSEFAYVCFCFSAWTHEDWNLLVLTGGLRAKHSGSWAVQLQQWTDEVGMRCHCWEFRHGVTQSALREERSLDRVPYSSVALDWTWEEEYVC